jgi:hypothetical protein
VTTAVLEQVAGCSDSRGQGNRDFFNHDVALPLFANFGMAGSEGSERIESRALLQQADTALLEAKRAAQTQLREPAIQG